MSNYKINRFFPLIIENKFRIYDAEKLQTINFCNLKSIEELFFCVENHNYEKSIYLIPNEIKQLFIKTNIKEKSEFFRKIYYNFKLKNYIKNIIIDKKEIKIISTKPIFLSDLYLFYFEFTNNYIQIYKYFTDKFKNKFKIKFIKFLFKFFNKFEINFYRKSLLIYFDTSPIDFLINFKHYKNFDDFMNSILENSENFIKFIKILNQFDINKLKPETIDNLKTIIKSKILQEKLKQL